MTQDYKEDFNNEIDRDIEKLIDNQDIVDEDEAEEKPECDMCGDTGFIEHGYWDDNDELVITKHSICECSQD